MREADTTRPPERKPTDAGAELVILANLSAVRGPQGGLVLTRKYLDGVGEFARLWPGPSSTLVRMTSTRSTDMDHVEILPGDLSFALEPRPADDESLARRLASAAVVLAFLSLEEAGTARLCQRIGIPLVYYSEYSPRTEAQIIDADTRNPLLRWRRKLWARGVERRRVAALRCAAGLQCSGAPTFRHYGPLHPETMMFFDNRVRGADVIDDAGLAAKVADLQSGRPLRLVFGGRLIAMKGVLDLPHVAAALRRRGIEFRLDIYGDGPLRSELAGRIGAGGLSEQVRLGGVLDFSREWIPRLKTQADLFVCCHPQGDPSSTYPEVMSCGVPIAGYDNEAFTGIVEHSGCGWVVPLGDADALADVVARLSAARSELAAAYHLARNFAAAHAFERTFARRTDHLIGLSRLIAAARPAAA